MKISGKIAHLIVSFVVYGVFLILIGWLLMATIETAHEVWWPVIPKIGYWHAVQLGAPLAVLGAISFLRDLNN
ncbi:hypothetical protein [Actinoallomurus sp. NPDC050550]|uniref:hypothetical protein n=1 Tax=Actinoallomurus sp. NPDC050550 TaxID=3154937 RepID=UPI0033E162D5